jgi:hypothetical protein
MFMELTTSKPRLSRLLSPRVLVVTALVVTVAFALGPTFIPAHRAPFEKVHIGMTPEEVKAIVGTSQNNRSESHTIINGEQRVNHLCWMEAGGRILNVWFEPPGGKCVKVKLIPGHEPAWSERVAARLGW